MFSSAPIPSWSLPRILLVGAVFCAVNLLVQSLVSQRSSWLILALLWSSVGLRMFLARPRIWDGVEERFTAPIATIPGGHLVRAGIRALPGFEALAYEAAMKAEAERVIASFIVWRGTGRQTGA